MAKFLRKTPWKISYSSNTHNTIADFYIPALESAIQYDRKSGFFSSAILSKVARGLGAMLHNQGKMRLIIGCQFTPEDLQAIEKGYELRDAIENLFTTSLILKSSGVTFEPKGERKWLLTYKGKKYMVTFYPDVFDETPTLRLISFGEPLFTELMGKF